MEELADEDGGEMVAVRAGGVKRRLPQRQRVSDILTPI
jgi:hypothetical protein